MPRILIDLLFKKSVNFSLDLFDHVSQVLGIICKIDLINIDDQQFSMFILRDPDLVSFIEAFKIIQPDGFFIDTASFLDLLYQVWYRRPEIYEQIGRFDQGTDQIEQGAVIFEVPGLQNSWHGG